MSVNNALFAFSRISPILPEAKTHYSIDAQHIRLMLMIFVLTFFCSPSAFSNNQENLELLRERIQALKKDLESKDALKQDTFSALQESERAIKGISNRLSKLIEKDKQAIEDYKQLQIQHKHLSNEIEIERNQLERLLYQQYVAGSQNYLQLVLNQQNPNQIARDLYYYGQLSHARSNSIKNLRIQQDKIETLMQISRQKKEEIAAIQAEYFSQRKTLEEEKKKHEIMLSRLSDQITKQQQEISRLEGDEKRITRLVNEINKLIAQEKSGNTLINNKLPEYTTTSASFPTLKGKLNLPVRGKLVNTFGSQREGKQLTWKGLFIQSPGGSEVKAISGGRVVFADWLRGFGHLIILDHGNSYMSLYGNNATLHKQVGDSIRGGDTIATVGNSGSNTDSGLYFELRYKGKPFDPMTWIKIE